MYCRSCSYALTHLPENRCPECGRGFDPADPKTFRRSPKRRWGMWALRFVVAALLIAGVPYGWRQYEAWQARRFEEAVTVLWENGGYLRAADGVTQPTTPRQLDTVEFYLNGLGKQKSMETVAPYLWRFPTFRLRIHAEHCPERLLAPLNGVDNIRCIEAEGFTDENLRGLTDLPNLQSVSISGPGITNAALDELNPLKAVKAVLIVGTQVTAGKASEFERSHTGAMVIVPWRASRPEFRVISEGEEGWLVRADPDGNAKWKVRLHHPYAVEPVSDGRVVVCGADQGLRAFKVDSGAAAWHVEGVCGRCYSNGHLLAAVEAEQPPEGSAGTRPHSVTGVDMSDGRVVFENRFPLDGVWNEYRLSALGKGFLCVASPGDQNTYIIDDLGNTQLHLKKRALAALKVDDGWVLLTQRDVERVHTDGSVAWSVPFRNVVVNTGAVLQWMDGNVLAVPYDASRDAFEALTLEPGSGKVRWRQFTQWAIRGVSHFYLLADVHAEIRGGVLAVTSRDFDGDIGVSVFDRQSGTPLGSGSAAGD